MIQVPRLFKSLEEKFKEDEYLLTISKVSFLPSGDKCLVKLIK